MPSASDVYSRVQNLRTAVRDDGSIVLIIAVVMLVVDFETRFQ